MESMRGPGSDSLGVSTDAILSLVLLTDLKFGFGASVAFLSINAKPYTFQKRVFKLKPVSLFLYFLMTQTT